MKLFISIITTLLTTVCAADLTAQSQLDTLPHYKIVWKLPLGVASDSVNSIRVATPVYICNFCGEENENVISMYNDLIGRQTWRTSPAFDTINIGSWNNLQWFKPIDFDGVFPPEYLGRFGEVYQCSRAGGKPILTQIDKIDLEKCAGRPLFSADINDDGYQDVICIHNASLMWNNSMYNGAIILGGPNVGRGCDRVRLLPMFNNHRFNAASALWRSVNGAYRLIQIETDEQIEETLSDWGDTTWVEWAVSYELSFKTGEQSLSNPVLSVEFRKIDSVKGQGYRSGCVVGSTLGNYIVENDAIAHRDYLFVGGKCTDFTDARFETTIPVYRTKRTPQYIGYSLGHDRPVMMGETMIMDSKDKKIRTLLSYLGEQKPFAVLWVHNKEGINFERGGFEIIDDQTGDGNADVLKIVTDKNKASWLYLLSADPNVQESDAPPIIAAKPVEDDEDQTTDDGTPDTEDDVVSIDNNTVAWNGSELIITTTQPASFNVRAVSTDARFSTLNAPNTLPIGTTAVELRSQLQNMSHGLYYLVVRVGTRYTTIGISVD